MGEAALNCATAYIKIMWGTPCPNIIILFGVAVTPRGNMDAK